MDRPGLNLPRDGLSLKDKGRADLEVPLHIAFKEVGGTYC